MIFEYALGGFQIHCEAGGRKGVRIRPTTDSLWSSNITPTRSITPHFLALTSTCRQVRSETALLPFRLNSFGEFYHFPRDDGNVGLLPKLLNRLSKAQKSEITTIYTHPMIMIAGSGSWFEFPEVRMNPNYVKKAYAVLGQLHGLKHVVLQLEAQGASYRSRDFPKAVRGVRTFTRRMDTTIVWDEGGHRIAWK
jgi:hypothetical protein